MAVLTAAQLTDLRQAAARQASAANYTKAQVNAAWQAIEDAWQATSNVGNRSVKTHFGQAVEGVAPGVFSVAAKEKLFAFWCVYNARREGVL